MKALPKPSLASNLVLFSVLAIGIGQSMTFALLAPLGREIGLTETQVGLMMTCSSLVFTLSGLRWGRQSDRWGRKPIILVGQLGYAFGGALFASAFYLGLAGLLSGISLYLLIISSRMLMAALMSAAPGAAVAYIADTTTVEERTSGMGRLGAARNLGTVLGPAVSGLFAIISLLAPLYIAAGMTLINAALIALLVPEPTRLHKSRTPGSKLGFFDRRYFPYVAIGLLTYTAYSMMTQTIGFYLQDSFFLDGKATAQAVGVGLMIQAIGAIFAQGYLVRKFRLSPNRLLAVGLPTLVVAYLALAFSGSLPMIFLVMGILGVGMGLTSAGYTAGASLAVQPEEQGALGGIIGACPSGGYVLGPLLGTALFTLYAPLPYLCGCAIMITLALYAWRVWR